MNTATNPATAEREAAEVRMFLQTWYGQPTYDGPWPDHFSHAFTGWQAARRATQASAEPMAHSELTDQQIFNWAEGFQFSYKGNPHKMSFSRPRFIEAVRTIIARSAAPDMSVRDALDLSNISKIARTSDQGATLTFMSARATSQFLDQIENLRSAPIGADQGVKYAD